MAEGSAELTEDQLVAWGTRVGREASMPLVLALDGDLGAGKSTLARAIARGAGVAGDVPSPTYNLLFQYDLPGGRRVQHLDLYRLVQQDDVWELGWAELGRDDGDLVLIEWAENAEMILPEPRWSIRLEECDDPARRRISLSRVGDAPPLPALCAA